MARTRQASQKWSFLSQAIQGYQGYTSPKTAHKTDQVFSEEILSRLSETAATVTRMKRMAGDTLEPDSMAALDSISESIEDMVKSVADTVPKNAALKDTLENGQADEIIDLDTEILEKAGNINQALSMMDLEGGSGVSLDELESVNELLDDLGDSLRQRCILIAG